jgi:ribonuclease G
MTRKRVRESLGEGLTEACPYCSGLGRIRSRESICHELFRELARQARSGQGADLVVGAHPEVAAMLAEDKSDVLSAIEKDLGGTIVVQARRDFHQERYEILRKGGSSHA